ncbi:MAG: hypothetical protein HQL26_04940 [Candidatus Omnitrophica bacterium]|nr:hypothetical protein [Candidatus Omnitrophota bacterium]
MKRLLLILTLGVVPFLSGCYTTGLSMGEHGSFNYANFVYGLYSENKSYDKKVARPDYPINLAVAQVGEVAPPEKMINKLNGYSNIFSSIMPISAGGDINSDYRQSYQKDSQNDQANIESRMRKMLLAAKDRGADYLFIFGGSAQYGMSYNMLSILDLTLVGTFIFPSNDISSEGKVAGALIEVATGRVVFEISAESELKKSYASAYANNKEGEVLKELRNTLIQDLTDKFIQKLG